MTNKKYKTMWVEETAPKTFTRTITTKNIDNLPQSEVLVRVRYSGLNYKDALSASGNKGVTKKYPHTPGIDASGEVVSDSTGTYTADTPVIVTS